MSKTVIENILKCIVFTSSTDACMNEAFSIEEIKEMINAIITEDATNLDLSGIYLYGDVDLQEDPEINKVLKQTLPTLQSE